MTEHKHTPGPWTIKSNINELGNCELIVKKDYSLIAETFWRLDNDTGIRSHDEREANARLIAAAPALLEALEFAVDDPDDVAALDKAKAAITLATGE